MTSQPQTSVPLWRDDRFWKIIFQLVVAAIVIGIIGLFIHNLGVNLQRAGLEFTFGFLTNSAGFSIGETLIDYSPNNTYIRALIVGILNTLRVILAGFVLTTILGILAGVASFSDNWLLKKLSLLYVEVVRNIPLLLQLIFWYFAVFLQLPPPREQLEVLGFMYMSKTGIYLPWPAMGVSFGISLGIVVALAIGAWVVYRRRTKAMVEQAASGQPQLMALVAMAIVAALLVLIGFQWEIPQSPEPGQVIGGLRMSLEYVTILVGLVVYTAAFIAEIVRAGIQSVSKGQWEAARSLGLGSSLAMRLVVFPQAMRVIIPPLNSQYMNLAKNSSLALAIGFPDIFSVSSTTLNQTGRPVEVFILLMSVYLLINLIISVCMNLLNQTVQFKER
ncbi:MAG: amino acid ABC transporter permease [Leptolyngbyaceae cyanobacterium]